MKIMNTSLFQKEHSDCIALVSQTIGPSTNKGFYFSSWLFGYFHSQSYCYRWLYFTSWCHNFLKTSLHNQSIIVKTWFQNWDRITPKIKTFIPPKSKLAGSMKIEIEKTETQNIKKHKENVTKEHVYLLQKKENLTKIANQKHEIIIIKEKQ